MTLETGDQAPDFTLSSDSGEQVSLRKLRGRRVVLYFYPKDQTPGCTTEACDFRDRLPALESRGALVFGISKDSVESHQRFKEKQRLNFPLLSDPGAEVMKAYGAWGEKTMYGKKVTGTIRTTVIIGEDGTIERVWRKVKVAGHADAVVEALG